MILKLFVTLFVGGYLIFSSFKILSIPYYNTILHPKPERNYIKNDILIYRDSFAIPHIKSQTAIESFYAIGYTHAMDRLWQLHFRRMASQGRLSEIMGAKTLDFDRYVRNLDMADSAKTMAEKMESKSKAFLQAYADGINDGVQSLSMLPIEFQVLRCKFQEWTVYDSVTFYKFLSMTNMHDSVYEFLRVELETIFGTQEAMILGSVGPVNQYKPNMSIINEEEIQILTKLWEPKNRTHAYKTHKSDIDINDIHHNVLPNYLSEWLFIPKDLGSNSWVVHGNLTESGKPHLASDPHLENQLPAMWYQAEMIFQHNNEEFYIIGSQMVALPFTLCGRTKYLAWGSTILYSDNSDFFEEKLTDHNNGSYSYEFKGKQLPVGQKNEIIQVKGEEAVNFTVLRTHHGPIMHYNQQRGTQKISKLLKHYSLQTIVQIDDFNGLGGYLDFMLESDINKALQHLLQIPYPNLGMSLASEDGHIAFMPLGTQVIRNGDPYRDAFVKEGWTGENEWIGFVSKEEHPYIIDPPKGYITLANHKYIATENKYNLGWNSIITARAIRLNNFFEDLKLQGKKVTIEHHKQLQSDVIDAFSQAENKKFIEILQNGYKFKGINDYLTQQSCLNDQTYQQVLENAIKILDGWDYRFSQDSQAATLITVFEYFYGRHILEQLHIKEYDTFINWNSYIYDSFHFKNIEDIYRVIRGESILICVCNFKIDQDKEILKQSWCKGNDQEAPCILSMITSINEAYCYLAQKFGETSTLWVWGNIHKKYYPHIPFKATPLRYIFDRYMPFEGSRRTVQPSQPDMQDSMTFRGLRSANFRFITSFDPKEQSYHILDTGISGNIFSSHYDDQMQLYHKGEYIEMKWGSSNLNQYKDVCVVKSSVKGEKQDF